MSTANVALGTRIAAWLVIIMTFVVLSYAVYLAVQYPPPVSLRAPSGHVVSAAKASNGHTAVASTPTTEPVQGEPGYILQGGVDHTMQK